jgi:uncharacterized Ntn-hydrolase superfamily protein
MSRQGGEMTSSATPRRPVSTYSIVARDDSGALGVAVQSHWFNVGSVVPWVEAGVGAVAVQSISDPATGARALELLRSGIGADAVLGSVLQGDADAAYRQIAVVDPDGNVATHTGQLCIEEAGHVEGKGFSVQANLMDRPTVWPAMAEAFERGDGDLAARLTGALEAAEAEGGDVRGRQSAALVIAPPPDAAGPRIDLRVEDSRDPLAELRRLLAMQRAYRELNRADVLMAEARFEEALGAYERATLIVPDPATDGEAAFWTGVAFAATGRVDEAESYLARAAAFGDRWARLLPRLVHAKMLPEDEGLLRRLLGTMER